VYTTDAKIARYGLVVLEDDAHFFPRLRRRPRLSRGFCRSACLRSNASSRKMRGSIDEDTMRKLNARAELDTCRSIFRVGGRIFLRRGPASAAPTRRGSRAGSRRRSCVTGLAVGLVGAALLHVGRSSAFRSAFSPMPRPSAGGRSARHHRHRADRFPSLALFLLHDPLLGIGAVPALAALFLYGLLPIVPEHARGLASIPGDLGRPPSRSACLPSSASPCGSAARIAPIVAGSRRARSSPWAARPIAAFSALAEFAEPIAPLSLNDGADDSRRPRSLRRASPSS